MTMKERIEQSLQQAFVPQWLDVQNESHRHNVPPGAQTHFSALIVSSAFVDQPPVQRHRSVYAAVAAELQAGLHALALKTLTPAEWDISGRPQSCSGPACRGGETKSA